MRAEKGLTVGTELKGTSNPETPKGYYITEYAVSSLAVCEKIKNLHKPPNLKKKGKVDMA